MADVPEKPIKTWAAVLNSGPKEFRNPIQEAKDTAKAAKAKEAVRRREDLERERKAYKRRMELQEIRLPLPLTPETSQ